MSVEIDIVVAGNADTELVWCCWPSPLVFNKRWSIHSLSNLQTLILFFFLSSLMSVTKSFYEQLHQGDCWKIWIEDWHKVIAPRNIINLWSRGTKINCLHGLSCLRCRAEPPQLCEKKVIRIFLGNSPIFQYITTLGNSFSKLLKNVHHSYWWFINKVSGWGGWGYGSFGRQWDPICMH